jgi:hypothetical protein
MFFPEHYFTSKSYAAVTEAFSNAYSDKEVPNEICNMLYVYVQTGMQNAEMTVGSLPKRHEEKAQGKRGAKGPRILNSGYE